VGASAGVTRRRRAGPSERLRLPGAAPVMHHRATMQPKPNPTCPRCGGPNDCAPARTGTFDTPCWCTTATIDAAAIAALPADARNEACLCRRCATAPASATP